MPKFKFNWEKDTQFGGTKSMSLSMLLPEGEAVVVYELGQKLEVTWDGSAEMFKQVMDQIRDNFGGWFPGLP